MILAVDATNLRLGGGTTHLINLAKNFRPGMGGVERLCVWGCTEVLDQLPDAPWIEKISHPLLEGGLPKRYLWLLFYSRRAFAARCDMLFSPGGLYFGRFRPYVTMSRNMLLFDSRERGRLGGATRLKLWLSRRFQIASLRRSAGAVFISHYAARIIGGELKLDRAKCATIHHGISDRFRVEPGSRDYDRQGALRVLYVSHFYEYKHPWNVVEAVARLRADGCDVILDLVGAGNASSLARLRESIALYDPDGAFVNYHGNRPYATISGFYRQADVFVYASTCENMPNILIEAMSSALPIASSRSEPMPEFLGDAGVYFDAENPADIAAALRELVTSPSLRRRLGEAAFKLATRYDWAESARLTFGFIGNIWEAYRAGAGKRLKIKK